MEKQEIRLEELYRVFSVELEKHMEITERVFGITGIMEQLFGSQTPSERSSFLKTNPAWRILETVYNYAVEGVPLPPDSINKMFSDAEFVLRTASYFGDFPSKEWANVISMSMVRNRMDYGGGVVAIDLALLAGVELRTVLDAVNDGKMLARDEGNGVVYISPVSASRWLLNRMDFKPTQARDVALPLGSVKTVLDFRTAILRAREKAGMDIAKAAAMVGPMVDAADLERLERGILDLRAADRWRVAEAYGLDGKEFEEAASRVFYEREAAWMSCEE